MNYTLVARKRAEKHTEEIYHWYQNQSSGLGDDFMLCLDVILITIFKNPLLLHVHYKNIRMAIVPRFPYRVFYFIDAEKKYNYCSFSFKSQSSIMEHLIG